MIVKYFYDEYFLSYFENPQNPKQKQYEALRSIFVDKMSHEDVATKFGYAVTTLYTLVRDVKSGAKILFPETKKGPKTRRTSMDTQSKIIFKKCRQIGQTNFPSMA